MAYYGRDYSTGRFTRRENAGYGGFGAGSGGFGASYDAAYGGSGLSSYGTWHGGGRYGWDEDTEGRRGWDDFGRPGFRDLAENRGRFGRGGYPEYRGEGGRGYDRFGTGFDYDRSGMNRGYTGYMGREQQGRDQQHFGGRRGYDYDEDFGDRLRRGWNRFRNEARSWMGRGYDRSW